MPYPSITSYLEAIQLPDSFKDLVGIELVLNSNNEPIIIAGGNAVVFKMRYNGKQVAIKCFINESEERAERYVAIADYLNQNPSPYFVTFIYYETELFIDGEEYSVVLMDWVEGKTLDASMLEAYRAEDSNLLRLQSLRLLDMFLFLLHQPIAHGDLKHENILVKENGELVLVDYDGMYVPIFEGKQSSEPGSKGYQHPNRNASWFDADLDNFSMLVLMLTHLYLAELPKNCTPESSGQFFTETDFQSLNKNQINACFQYKICRQIAAFLIDILEESELLKGINDFFRSIHYLINELIEKSIEIQKNNSKLIFEISNYYFERGLLYENGDGVPHDFIKAIEFYLKAAELGNSNAMVNIGSLYLYGQGVHYDKVKTFEWYSKAADLENTDAMIRLGLLYKNGHGTFKDYTKAFEWNKKAAEFGNNGAMNNIGVFYSLGQGVPQNYDKAMEWFRKAANLGNISAIENISILSINPLGIVSPDYANAKVWFLKAAELGDSTAMNQIAQRYKNGKGVPQDYNKAMEWYLKSAELGDGDSIENIIYLYINELGVSMDSDKTRMWNHRLRLIKEKFLDDISNEMSKIGNPYQRNYNDPVNELALYYEEAELGNTEAMKKIADFYSTSNAIHRNYRKAMKYYRKAAELGDIEVMKKLADIYESGRIVSKDYNKAMEWYLKAVELGDTEAIMQIAYLYEMSKEVKYYIRANPWD